MSVQVSVQKDRKEMASENKTKRFEVRLSPSMLKRINKEAKNEDETAADFVRQIIEGYFLKLDSERSYDPSRED